VFAAPTAANVDPLTTGRIFAMRWPPAMVSQVRESGITFDKESMSASAPR
jgi:hypothetical protein